MRELTSKGIALRVTGEVVENSFPEFEKMALVSIGNINTELNTDNDFIEAKQDIKDCKSVEVYLSNKKTEIIDSMRSVSALLGSIDSLSLKVANTRLPLSKNVKTREGEIKLDTTAAGVKKVNDHLNNSQVKHGFNIDIQSINGAIKNKRTIESMKKAVAEVVGAQIFAIDELEKTFLENLKNLTDAEKEYPGLFPDKQNLSLSGVDVVGAQIESRINKFKFDLQEKQEKERVAKAEKARKEQEEKDLKVIIEEEKVAPVKRAAPPSFDEEHVDISNNIIHKDLISIIYEWKCSRCGSMNELFEEPETGDELCCVPCNETFTIVE